MGRLVKMSIDINKNITLNNKLKQLEDICIHKEYIMKATHIFCKYLFEINRDCDALQLLNRSFIHDISKTSKIEFYGFAKFAFDLDALKDPNRSILKEKEYYIDIHRSNNKHHPEYWDSILDMTELDIMELCVDWFARSWQFDTDVIEFLEIKQETQFHFPQNIYNKIKKYLLILKEQKNKERL